MLYQQDPGASEWLIHLSRDLDKRRRVFISLSCVSESGGLLVGGARRALVRYQQEPNGNCLKRQGRASQKTLALRNHSAFEHLVPDRASNPVQEVFSQVWIALEVLDDFLLDRFRLFLAGSGRLLLCF